ncbi:hypothetical protein AMTRI_Chr02g218180 [Amborella trichopoda]
MHAAQRERYSLWVHVVIYSFLPRSIYESFRDLFSESFLKADMNLLHSKSLSSTLRFKSPERIYSREISSRLFSIRCCLPFPREKAKHYRELEVAIDVVQSACRICIDVKKSLSLNDGRIVEKNDQTPVTIADFSVQALISLELNRSFPSIPLVAEEDSTFLRSSLTNSIEDKDYASSFLVDSVLAAVIGKASIESKPLSQEDVLNAIDRGGSGAHTFDAKPSTYWVLDPIDGTRGFLKGRKALYVVGLALVVEGEIAVGVLGCPNWKEESVSVQGLCSEDKIPNISECHANQAGILMVSHVGCGTWTRRLSSMLGNMDFLVIHDGWTRCSVDPCAFVYEARFCIPDSQTWESLPLSTIYSSTTDMGSSIKDKTKLVLKSVCCGSLCKYLMVAMGMASVFILRARMKTVIKVWDHVAGMICVSEAGGRVTDWKGSDLELAADKLQRRVIFPVGGVLVTNGALHNHILQMISTDSSRV